MINHKNIRNIIFDLGGVVINLDINRMLSGFRDMGLVDVEKYYTQFNQVGLFDKFETGKISGEEFIAMLGKLFPIPQTRESITAAWNSMILDFPVERANRLLELKEKYKTFVLSNTNEIHLSYFFKGLEGKYGLKDMLSFFHKEYYSCRLGKRKPDIEIFEYVLNENRLRPEETLFIDDSPQHVEAAGKTGIIAHHLVEPEGILGLLKDF